MFKQIIFLFFFFIYSSFLMSIEKKAYHHLPNGTFRNPEGSPKRFKDGAQKFGYSKNDVIIFKIGELKKIKRNN